MFMFMLMLEPGEQRLNTLVLTCKIKTVLGTHVRACMGRLLWPVKNCEIDVHMG